MIMCLYNCRYYRAYYGHIADLKSAWRHRRENHSCEEISPCPYIGKILLEKRRFSDVNQIDEEFDPDRPRRQIQDENTGAAEEEKHSAREVTCCCVIS